MAVIAVVLAIVIAAPEYAEPAVGAGPVPSESTEPSPDPLAEPVARVEEVPTSALPTDLKGYRWPVRGGMLAKYYDYDRDGRFVIKGQRTHTGLVITFFEGAYVKAAHKGTVVAAGRDWARHIGYDGSLDEVYEKLKSKGQKDSLGVVINDGNGYYSVYTELKDLSVKPKETVKGGQIIGRMSRAEKRQMMRYRLVRMDGLLMKVHASDRERGYPFYTREHVDPLVVFNTDAKKKPNLDKRRPPDDPPRLSEY